MTENNKNERNNPQKGIDQVVKSAIERVLNESGARPEAKSTPQPEAAPGKKRGRPKKKEQPASAQDKAQPAKKPADKPAPAPDKQGHRGQPAAGGKAGEKRQPAVRHQRKRQAQKPTRAEEDASPSLSYLSNPLAQSPQQKRGHNQPEDKDGRRDYKLKIIPLGGLGEIGKNMTLIQYDQDILVVDGGLSFPDDSLLGIDAVIPDYTYLIERRDHVRAFLLTHGHEDHIGGMPYILQDVQAPVYGSTLTLGLLKGKLNEYKIQADLRQVAPREEIEIGPFKVEFFRVTHSIPDSMGMAIHTPLGVIMIVSDFKMDMSPIDGKLMDFGRISALGEKGVLLLMSDSTNVEKEGFSASERTIGYNLDRIFLNAPGRIIITCFASHVHRVQQALWAAERIGRKVAIVGRGMENMFSIAGSLGYLEIPNNLLIEIDKINSYPANRVVVITTGSQGEPLSGLTRMSAGEHRQVQIMAGDTVVISATPIPGNERTVGRTVDNLFRLGATVIHERNQGIHVSGHASREELKFLLNMVKPRFFLPMHGEYRMLYKHAQLAQQIGMPAENTFVIENGQTLEVQRRHCRIGENVPSGRVLIDGLGVGDVGNTVLKERRQLGEGGVVVVSLLYTKDKGKRARILLGPEISSRGFIFEKEYEHIIGEMKEKVVALCTAERLTDGNLNDLRNQVRAVLSRFVMERTRRKPVIMTVISEV